ncbi:hypothetical protein EZV62_011339 [Acer yangbiense]|uniref:Alpha/beta hydrolase fold-3 domain-containing protein n=1 Tax=Acer yangbiense TaxID=1000413 RepID=A0A5C7I5H7_9ROSI|nr:hypothetical protein EZV62_011339 [Acer yangbiense]
MLSLSLKTRSATSSSSLPHHFGSSTETKTETHFVDLVLWSLLSLEVDLKPNNLLECMSSPVQALDILQERGWYYAQNLRQRGWSGHQVVIDFQGEGHVFHLKNLTSRNSTILRNRIVTFINEKWSDASVLMEPSCDSSNFMVGCRPLHIPKISSDA